MSKHKRRKPSRADRAAARAAAKTTPSTATATATADVEAAAEHRAPDPGAEPGADLARTTRFSPRVVSLLATLALIFLTIGFGSTYFLVKDVVNRIPTLDFLAVRFAISTLVLVIVAPRAVLRMSSSARRHGVVLGLLYAAGMVAQTFGLEHTSASVSGFITGLYVVITPMIAAAVLRTHVSVATWTAAMVAMVGVGVLSLNGFALGFGEIITFFGAIVFALHILGLARWSAPADAIGMTIVQVAVISLSCFAFTAYDGVVLPASDTDWASLLYMALVVGAAGLLAQTWAQAHLSATKAAIILSIEPVFAAAFAVAFGGEILTMRLLVGGALVVFAMLLSELAPRRHVEAEVPHIAV